jgi:hypothetical protein
MEDLCESVPAQGWQLPGAVGFRVTASSATGALKKAQFGRKTI